MELKQAQGAALATVVLGGDVQAASRRVCNRLYRHVIELLLTLAYQTALVLWQKCVGPRRAARMHKAAPALLLHAAIPRAASTLTVGPAGALSHTPRAGSACRLRSPCVAIGARRNALIAASDAQSSAGGAAPGAHVGVHQRGQRAFCTGCEEDSKVLFSTQSVGTQSAMHAWWLVRVA